MNPSLGLPSWWVGAWLRVSALGLGGGCRGRVIVLVDQEVVCGYWFAAL